jgi:hypothetical protein
LGSLTLLRRTPIVALADHGANARFTYVGIKELLAAPGAG